MLSARNEQDMGLLTGTQVSNMVVLECVTNYVTDIRYSNWSHLLLQNSTDAMRNKRRVYNNQRSRLSHEEPGRLGGVTRADLGY